MRPCIPRGFACRSVEWLGRRCAARVKPAKKSGGETRRVSRRTHGQVCEGFLRDPSLKRSGNAPDRYTAFFAKLFFTRKKSGGATHPTATWLFFAKLFFHLEKKAVIFWIFWIFLLFWQRFCHLAVLFWWGRGNLLRWRWFFSCQLFQF